MSVEVFKQGLELFADAWQAPGSIDLKTTGDLDDYITLSTTSNRPLISGTGNYLVLGKDAATGHSLDADDVLFGEDIEVDGMAWLDGGVTLGTSGIVIGDIGGGSILPFIAYNAAGDAYVSLDSGDDAVAGNKGLAFYAAADEDVEIINLTNTTGTPRIFWDESEDNFAFSHAIAVADIVFSNKWVMTEDELFGVILVSPENKKYRMVEL